MIDYLRGLVVQIEPEYIVMDVGGVGYRVFSANPFGFQGMKDTETVVYIHYHVRDDAHLLYGFASREEQAMFRKLLDVSGIGPRVAIGILSGGKPQDIAAAVQQENIAFLTKLPGIGRKTAQRMILDLKDKLGSIASIGDGPSADGKAMTDVSDHAGIAGSAAWQEAKAALAALGYTEAELDRAWGELHDSIDDRLPVDELMRRALQVLYRG